MSNHKREVDIPDFQSKPAVTAVLASNGEYWTIGYAEKHFSLKASKGLSYIYRLIQYPGQEFHALDLLIGPGIGVTSQTANADPSLVVGPLGHAGEMLDSTAKDNYRNRLVQLREEMEDALEMGNSERAAEIESEIDFLAREISRAVGLGGRDRFSGSAAERARLNVTRAIRVALQKISERQAHLGELLEVCIRTGLFCRYVPNPRFPISWQLSPEGIEAHIEETGAPEPLLLRGETYFLSDLPDQTKFVGRRGERDAMRRHLEQTRRGDGRVLMIAGEPGVGKTRIAKELGAEAAQRGFLTFAGGCYDRQDSVPFSPFVEILEALARTPDQPAFRAALGDDAAELSRLVPRLRRIFPDIPPALELPPDQSRESRRILFNACREFLARNASDRPVLLLLEDLQWADEGTLSLINYLSRSIGHMPVMIVGTYRDDEIDTAAPLAQMLDELIHLRLPQLIRLQGLAPSAVAEMIQAMSGREPSTALATFIHANTEGNPLFVEELYRHLYESGEMTDVNGEFLRDLKLTEVEVPHSLRMVIGRRLGRLAGETRKILAVAAVIGRSFTFDLLEASTGEDPEPLLDQIEECEKAALISSTLQFPEARFRFSHELIRKAVLGDLSAPRRQRLHLRVAEAIERICQSSLEDQANELAHHLLQAGTASSVDKTVKYLVMAAKRALAQSAFKEAEDGYRQARALLNRMSESQERDLAELEVCSGFVQVLQLTRGYAATETFEIVGRARALAEKVGNLTELILQEVRTWRAIFVKGDYDHAAAIGDRILDLAQREGRQKRHLAFAHGIQIQGRFYRGDFLGVEEHLTNLRDLGAAPDLREPGDIVITMGVAALSAWATGLADSARARIDGALAFGRNSNNPYDLAFALLFESYLWRVLRAPERAANASTQMLELSELHGFSYGADLARGVLGWARAQLGNPNEGISMIQQALTSLMKGETRVGITDVLTRLAEAQALDGAIDQALYTIEEALCANPEELVFRPNVLTCRGNLRHQLGQAESAESDFREAMAIGQMTSARALELRAAMGLARVLVARGDRSTACDLLAPLYGGFSEGLDTRDLKETKSLLDELSN